MAKAIMIQGTASNAGKSLIAGGLCRILRQDGYSVAPFKSQNMALNSYITINGLEMGRAQVMQAECAKKEPDARMNPILLKPVGDSLCQVIVNGVALGNMKAADYFSYKKSLTPNILECFESLARENDIIVIEGAGSPAEINLKKDDIVNMGLAKITKAPVLIAGDIDRGGVFASIYGTIALMAEDERSFVKGVIINKFRGDADILKPGLDMLTDLIHVPVVGVVPYLEADIDDEDSLSPRFARKTGGDVDIAVVRLPRISNFTDFNIFSAMGGVSLRYVGAAAELKNPDLVILPGTKNTMGDLAWLRSSGLEREIMRYAEAGGAVLGICGGYQMLGTTLKDPSNLEHGGEMAGLGLLECETVFLPEKTRKRVTGKFLEPEGVLRGLRGAEFEGYEIHMGRTTPLSKDVRGFAAIKPHSSDTVQTDGLNSANIYGTYVHGLFDAENVAAEIVRALCVRKGIDFGKITAIDGKAYKESQYDLLADCLRRSLNMEQIYGIIESGVK